MSSFDEGISVGDKITAMPSSSGDQSLQLMTLFGVSLVLLGFGDEVNAVAFVTADAMT